MPQELTQKAVNTFVKGLITEANELTFPPDASVDELNCELERSGNRRRRLGFQIEDNDTPSSWSLRNDLISSVNYWDNVGGSPGLTFIVFQRGRDLYFYEQGVEPLSEATVKESYSSSTVYSINMNRFKNPRGNGPQASAVQAAAVNGVLVVTSPDINAFYVERDQDDGTFTETEISFRIRDFGYASENREDFDLEKSYYTDLGQTVAETIEADFDTAARTYDTLNSGWVRDSGGKGLKPLKQYQDERDDKFPPLNRPWFIGKDSNGDFDVDEFRRVQGGTTIIPNGHYIANLYQFNRTQLAGVDLKLRSLRSDVERVVERSRFKTVAAYAGRSFFSGMESKSNGNRVYFSQLLDDIKKVGDCFQINDPTAENENVLLDTDGGFVSIPEAKNILRLHVFGPRLYVFAENGVWAISGVDDVFRATEYAVSKVTQFGLNNFGSFVSADGRPYWWSKFGIHALVEDQLGQVREQNISINTVQTFFQEIAPDSRDKVVSGYDYINRKIFWLYPDNDETVTYKRNRILIFDEQLGAFYPWRVEDDNIEGSYILGIINYEVASYTSQVVGVRNEDDDVVVSSSGDVRANAFLQGFDTPTALKFIVRKNDNTVTFGQFSDISFRDWGAVNYSSFVVTGYDFMGDLTRQKNALYITAFLERTETGFTLSGGEYSPTRPSGCTVKTFWDFNTTSTTAQQAYRLKYPVVVDPDDPSIFDYPETVVSTRLKVRGRGRSMNIRFEGEDGKDFNLLGWEIIGARNPRV